MVVKIPERIETIMDELRVLYNLRTFEDKDPYRVLIRTILSQRTRDENTDQASAELFAEYPTMEDVAIASQERLEKLVKKAGFFRVKSKRIKEVSNILLDEYEGIVPDTMDELLKLPGVGRKTANCVLVYAFEKPAIPVDTHVHRISNRIGLVNTKDPDATERELEKVVPKEFWIELNDLMVQFGQDICRPIGPKHEECPIAEICDYYQGILNQEADGKED
ncbi:MAG: endonuclease III [Methanobacteriaceae archaeon]|nr:endonuclease III [Methanobacteriaceae archaeon]MDP2837617.1 endonuclease III [Methanobacteriaceae archaeon]MDP3035256.1 endonuclease III [Methanobacteriaceae archaeon]MDP3485753.1 endonuclease III [Methanobacteriaceae archaeon]MDP3624719.1 endonuclease III [Methanobacteriaceae archaeon]